MIRHDGRLYIQYWLYYPDSNSAWAGRTRSGSTATCCRCREVVRGTAAYPGFHEDDWEGYSGPDRPGRARLGARDRARALPGLREAVCRDRWIGASGWTRVSRGSHAGHVPFRVNRGRHDPLDGPGVPRFDTPPRPPHRTGPAWLVPGRNLDERTSSGEGVRLIPARDSRPRLLPTVGRGVKPPWRKRAYTDPETGES